MVDIKLILLIILSVIIVILFILIQIWAVNFFIVHFGGPVFGYSFETFVAFFIIDVLLSSSSYCNKIQHR
jgi:hypothetical protein